MSTSHNDGQRTTDGLTIYQEIQASDDFQDLRRRFRGFVFPMTAAFLIWYFAYVLAVTFAPGLMSIKVIGNINLGLIFGLLQFVTTFAITMTYVRWADKVFDPRADEINRRFVDGGH